MADTHIPSKSTPVVCSGTTGRQQRTFLPDHAGDRTKNKMHIEHINISAPVEILIKTRDFYCDVFGLVNGHRPNFKRAGFWLYSDGKPLIHLTESNLTESNEDFQVNITQGYFDHFAFQLSGLGDFIANLESLKMTYKIEYLRETGVTQVFIRDPSGIGVEASFPGESQV